MEEIQKRWNPKKIVESLYKDDYGNPFQMTPTQELIFECIFKKQSPDGRRRLLIIPFTQFGKSETASMAVLTRACTFPEKWAIIAPSQQKARILIGYVIKHIFENEYTLARFRIDEGENLERLRRERSRNRLTFDLRNGQMGEIFILSAESRLRNEENIGNALMGFGSPNVVIDEAALVDDRAEAKAIRMVGGFTPFGTDFIVKIGNPFKRNHFLRSFNDPAYYKIIADYEVGIKEGRLTKEFVDEMRDKPFFRVLYECKFPREEEIDEKGWTPLLTEDDIENAMKYEDKILHAGDRRLGVDVARSGSNYSVWVNRSMNYMELVAKAQIRNLTEVAARTSYFIRECGIGAYRTYIDDIGVGGGVVDTLISSSFLVQGINVGKEARDNEKFMNIRGEAYWRLREWIKKGGMLSKHEEWYQLTQIKYKPDFKGRIKVMSKDDMRGLGIESPDVADAAALTFVDPEERAERELNDDQIYRMTNVY